MLMELVKPNGQDFKTKLIIPDLHKNTFPSVHPPNVHFSNGSREYLIMILFNFNDFISVMEFQEIRPCSNE